MSLEGRLAKGRCVMSDVWGTVWVGSSQVSGVDA